MVSACQSANLRLDIFSASSIEEVSRIPHVSDAQRCNERDDSNKQDGRREGGKVAIMVKMPVAKTIRKKRKTPFRNSTRSSTHPMGVMWYPATRSITAVACSVMISFATRRPMGGHSMMTSTDPGRNVPS